MSARALRSSNRAVTSASSSGASPRASRQSLSQETPHVVLPQLDVSAVDLLGFLDVALLKEQGTQNVADGLHLTPRFVVSQVERQVDAAAQFVKGSGEIAGFAGFLGEELAAVFDFSLQDGGVDVEDGRTVSRILIHHVVVQHAPGEGRVLELSLIHI